MARLVKALRVEDYEDSISAAEALGDLGPRAAPAVPDLIQALRDDEGQTVREFGCAALVKIGVASPEVAAALRELLTDSRLNVPPGRHLGAREAGATRGRVLMAREPDPGSRIKALRGLGRVP